MVMEAGGPAGERRLQAATQALKRFCKRRLVPAPWRASVLPSVCLLAGRPLPKIRGPLRTCKALVPANKRRRALCASSQLVTGARRAP